MTTTITLEDVLAAAGARKVALAPETSGYLVLALADATSRLPFAIDGGETVVSVEPNSDGSDGGLKAVRGQPVTVAWKSDSVFSLAG